MQPVHHSRPVLGRYASEALSRREAPAQLLPLPDSCTCGRFTIAYDGLRFVHSGHRWMPGTGGRHDQAGR